MIITEAWSHPATGTFERKRVLDCSACSFTDYRRQIGRGSLTLKPYDSADDVVYVDPDDHTNDVDSVIRHYRANDGSGKELIAEWIASDEPDSASEGPTSISGSAIEALLDLGIVQPWDWDGTTDFYSRFPDWIYGGRNILPDPEFSDPQCEPRISEFWTEATSGAWVLNAMGDTINPAFNVDATTLENAIEGMTGVTNVLVSGSGAKNDPWRVVWNDPCVPTGYSVATGTMNAPLNATLIQTGAITATGYTPSQTVGYGVSVNFGDYTTFALATPPSAPPCGTQAMHIVGTVDRPNSFPGIQTVPRVIGGGLYQAGIWVYSAAGGNFRLVVRPITEEPLIASSTWPTVTVPATTWTWIPITDVMVPDGVDTVIFRLAQVAAVGASVDFWVACPEMNEGQPAATAGKIMIDILDSIQTDFVGRPGLPMIQPGFDAAFDSATVPTAWAVDESVNIQRGLTVRQVLERVFQPRGYEWALNPLGDSGVWQLEFWQKGSRGGAVSADVILGRDVVAASARQSVPRANVVTAEGGGQRFATASSADSITALGWREAYVGDVTFLGSSLPGWATEKLERLLDDGFAPSFDLADGPDWPVPLADFNLADTITVAIRGRSVVRPVEVVGFRDGDVEGLVWATQFGTPTFQGPQRVGWEGGVFGGGIGNTGSMIAPVAEAARLYLDERRRLPDYQAPSTMDPGGGGGMAHILIVSTSEPQSVQAKADFVVPSSNSSTALTAIIDGFGNSGTIWMAGKFELDSDVSVWGNGVRIRGLGDTDSTPPPVAT